MNSIHSEIPIPPRPGSKKDLEQRSAFARQEGGGHYKGMKIQPVEYIHRNGIGFIEGNVIKYVSRWRSKGGIEDLRKARHFIDLLIEMEGARTAPPTDPAPPEPTD